MIIAVPSAANGTCQNKAFLNKNISKINWGFFNENILFGASLNTYVKMYECIQDKTSVTFQGVYHINIMKQHFGI